MHKWCFDKWRGSRGCLCYAILWKLDSLVCDIYISVWRRQMEHAHLQNHPRTSRYTMDTIFIPYLSHITCKSSATSHNKSGNNDFCSNRKKRSLGVVEAGGTSGSMTERERTKNQANRSRNEQDMIQKCWEVRSRPLLGKVAVARISENGCKSI
jgi:hypothetical protein